MCDIILTPNYKSQNKKVNRIEKEMRNRIK